jgi:signal transduction protein with GAF and PtsI domain
MTNPSAAASERAREHAQVLIHHWKQATGIQVGIHYAEGDERQLTDLIASELSARDAEIERLKRHIKDLQHDLNASVDEMNEMEARR